MIFQQALSKKENKGGGGGSPGGDDSDGDIETNLTPRTEAKYNKIDEEFLIHMQHRNHVNGGSRNLQVRLPKTGSDYDVRSCVYHKDIIPTGPCASEHGYL